MNWLTSSVVEPSVASGVLRVILVESMRGNLITMNTSTVRKCVCHKGTRFDGGRKNDAKTQKFTGRGCSACSAAPTQLPWL